MEIKEIKEIVDAGLKGLEAKIGEELKGDFKEQFESAKSAIALVIEGKGYQTAEQVETALKAQKEGLEQIILELKKNSLQARSNEKKSFTDIVGSSLEDNKEVLGKLANKQSNEAVFVLTKANEDLDPANWAGDSYDIAASERRGLYEFPFMPVWLRNLFPNSTTTKGVIHYLVENGENGAAGIWDGSPANASLVAKPGEAPKFNDATVTVEWIAGITRVKREMLDDVEWLRSYIARTLTTGRKGLWVAENTLILAALDAASTPYDGALTNQLEMIVDAAFGQLKDNYYNPTVILMNNRDAVKYINLNKASGSGEYDAPIGVVAVIGGQLYIGGVPVVSTPIVAAGEAYVIDGNATEFISRMSPEVRAFEEDRDNVIKNLVTFRAEERVAFLVYDEKAVIKVTLATT